MYYDIKCKCCNAVFTMMYSGEDYSERLKKFNYEDLDSAEKSGLTNLIVAVEKGNPYMAISMDEVPNMINTLQKAYREYQEVQKILKKTKRLKNSIEQS